MTSYVSSGWQLLGFNVSNHVIVNFNSFYDKVWYTHFVPCNSGDTRSHFMLLTLDINVEEITMNPSLTRHMGGFAQFGLNWFKRGQKRLRQLQLSLDTEKLKSCNFVCSSITARRGFAKVICRDCDHCKCPKILFWNTFSNHSPYM